MSLTGDYVWMALQVVINAALAMNLATFLCEALRSFFNMRGRLPIAIYGATRLSMWVGIVVLLLKWWMSSLTTTWDGG